MSDSRPASSSCRFRPKPSVKAAIQAFTEVATKYSGTEEGVLWPNISWAPTPRTAGTYAESEKHLKKVIDYSDQNFSSVAKLALAKV